MKSLLLICLPVICLGFFDLSAHAQSAVYETVCKNENCLKDGWVTTAAPDYALKTECKLHDCAKHGWISKGNDKTLFEVTCRQGACFEFGWKSFEDTKGFRLYDSVTCNDFDCLKNGWTVRTGYDFFGGSTKCTNQNCREFGGASNWRGHPSKTVCHNDDCYKFGWTLYVY